MENLKLKPCPFCGGEAIIYPKYWVYCKRCAATTKVYRTEEAAAAGWNRRVGETGNNPSVSGKPLPAPPCTGGP